MQTAKGVALDPLRNFPLSSWSVISTSLTTLGLTKPWNKLHVLDTMPKPYQTAKVVSRGRVPAMDCFLSAMLKIRIYFIYSEGLGKAP